ncbi:5217_t:CDS:2 [Paraglomus occultum]|uniref:5217_t:CDS:1 n=1 Tax=Paraglomus occultum TaxID=144539 RepID=A0A9N9GJX7_9GLOM|nr:5217_t:CDS:2 [Paraglomus occultum]
MATTISEDLNVIFRPVIASDIDRAHQIEVDCFPADEAEPIDKFRYREANCPDLFLGAYLADSDRLIGYIAGTGSSTNIITAESMTQHEPEGRTVCIHSVCVDRAYRRKGLASQMMNEYITRIRQQRKYEKAALISHQHLIPFYESFGFRLFGESNIQLGRETWFDLTMDLITN